MSWSKINFYGLLAITISFYFDDFFSRIFTIIRLENLLPSIFFFTNIIFPAVLIFSGIWLFLTPKFIDGFAKEHVVMGNLAHGQAKHRRWFSVYIAILSLALGCGSFLKYIFAITRPETALLPNIPVQISTFSFPSIHTTEAFAIATFFAFVITQSKSPLAQFFILKKEQVQKISDCFQSSWQKLFFVSATIIGIGRIYEGVHFFSDVLAGALLGINIAWSIIYLEKHFEITHALYRLLAEKHFEIRRQLLHILAGLILISLIRLEILDTVLLTVILITGGLISFLIKTLPHHISFLNHALELFEREHHKKEFPGKGAFFLVAGTLISMLLFPLNIALAAIIILTIGDAISHIVGRFFGNWPNPLNPKKNLEGFFVAIIFSTFSASFFVTWPIALLGSLAGMLIETPAIRLGKFKIDDNLTVPLVAGVAMFWIM